MAPAKLRTRAGNLVRAEWRAVAGRLAGLAGRTKADRGAAADERRLACLGLGGLDRLGDFLGVVAVHLADDLPAVGLEAGGGVVGEGGIVDRGFARAP